jgi:Tol biopolymer transport system component
MTRDRSVDERISAWLLDEAPDQLPDRVLRATFDRTRASRQHRTILGWRPTPMNRIPGRLVALAAAVAAIAIVYALIPRANQSVGGAPSPTPSTAASPATAITQPTGTPTPTLVPVSLTGQVAFERSVGGNTDIYLMNLNRSGLTRLTDDPAIDARPSWSADGTRILFTRGSGDGRDVYVMNADGSGQTRLTSSPEGEDSAAFSPDGSQIVFLRYVDPTYFDVFTMDVDGSNQHRIWHKDGVWAAQPRWSPDGTAIFFNEDETGGGGIDIVRLVPETGALVRVVTGPGDDSSFDISPDGTTIAFQSDRTPGGLFLVDADGSNVRHLTGTWDKGSPVSWSRDGKFLMVQTVPFEGVLELVAVDGGDPISWTDGASPAWRPEP